MEIELELAQYAPPRSPATRRRVLFLCLAFAFGSANTLSIVRHFLLPKIRNWHMFSTGLPWFMIGAVCIGLAFVALEAIAWLARRGVSPRLLVTLALVAIAASGVISVATYQAEHGLAWISAAGALKNQPAPAIIGIPAWGEQYPAIELHATVDNDPQWMYSASAELGPIVKLLGDTIILLVTQPEYAVFDAAGGLQENDGVTVRVLSIVNQAPLELQTLELNLHQDETQRKWHQLNLRLPRGSQSIIIQALPGAPGSHNWNDRVWINIDTVETFNWTMVFSLADWLSRAQLIFGFTCLAVVLVTLAFASQQEEFEPVLSHPIDVSADWPGSHDKRS